MLDQENKVIRAELDALVDKVLDVVAVGGIPHSNQLQILLETLLKVSKSTPTGEDERHPGECQDE